MAISEELELDISGALASIEDLRGTIETLGDTFSTSINDAIDAVDAAPLTQTITDAAASADVSGQVTDDLAAIDASPLSSELVGAAQDADISGTVSDGLLGVDASPITSGLEQSVVDADLGGSIDEALASANVVIPVEADTGSIPGDVEAALDQIDTTITLDTGDSTGQASELSEGLQGIGESAKDAQGGIDGASIATDAFGGVASLATGNSKALTGLLGKLGPGGKTAAVGIGALVGVVGTFFAAGTKAEASTQRFTSTLGSFADEAKQIRVGTLNIGLADLARKMGTSQEATQDATSSLFQYADGAGFSGKASVEFANTVQALAANAVALNPALGSTAEVASDLSSRLAKGGKSVAGYGIELSKADIAARAAENATRGLGDGVSTQALAFAGAQLAGERYGGSLKENIETGSRNAAIQQRALTVQLQAFVSEAGRPLVKPLTEAMRELTPLLGQVATNLGALITSFLPIVSAAARVGGAIGSITSALKGGGGGGGLLGAIAEGVIKSGPFVKELSLAAEAAGLFSDESGDAVAPAKALASSLGEQALATGVLTKSQLENIVSSSKNRKGQVDYGEVQDKISGKLDARTAAESKAAAAEAETAQATEDAADALDLLNSRLSLGEEGFDRLGVSIAKGEIPAASFGAVAKNLGISVEDLGAIVDAVEGQIQQFADTVTSALPGLGDVFAELGRPQDLFKGLRDAIADRESAIADATAARQKLGESGTADAAAIAEADGRVVEAIADGDKKVADAQAALFDSVDPEVFLKKLQQQASDIANFQANLATLVARGFGNLAANLAQQGPVVAGGITQALTNAQPGTLQSLNDLFSSTGLRAAENFHSFAVGTFGPIVADGGKAATDQFGIAFNPAAAAGAATALVPPAITAQTDSIILAAQSVGFQLTEAFKGQVVRVPTVVAQAMIDAGVAVQVNKNSPLAEADRAGAEMTIKFTQAYDPATPAAERTAAAGEAVKGQKKKLHRGGKEAGESLMEGIVSGLQSHIKTVGDTIIDVAGGIVSGFKRAILGGSPARVMIPLGFSISEGIAVGIASGIPEVNAALATLNRQTIEQFNANVVPLIEPVQLTPAVAAALPVSAGPAAAVTAGPVTSAQADLQGTGAGVHIGQLIVQTAAKDQTQVGIEVSRQLRAESFRAGR